ncbi:DRTGG domain-containing protein [Sunxiuqinia elliptica]|uniref:DRTGG domain-containing protein n=1 Tax=Sunxiuqinia elliptica TaxID=655355 RepID=A0A1I2L2Z2_9BACT|nr:DRTGG domain-containing protein [Sunxiuqinia elliptica]TDN96689.1 DRTGG domain-containing protein [Sunxiuqinia elliptica]TDO55752.1 DRTGG domain-containing protein [Sunxiuqinia elliptica]SFF72928.1 DRTGG domain-containing protein [Sunxiuqinia elliptica]
MKVSDLIEQLNLEVISGEKGLDREVTGAYVSDLLSDVMGNARESQMWITLQVHQNVMAIASLKDLAAVILVKGLRPHESTIRHSNDEQIPILSTTDSTFEISGKLFELLKKEGCLA